MYFKTLHPNEKSAYDAVKSKTRSLTIMAKVILTKNESKTFKNSQILWKNLNCFLHCQKRHHKNEDYCVVVVQSFNTFFLEKVEKAHTNIELRLNNQSLDINEKQFENRSNSNSVMTNFENITSTHAEKIIRTSCNKTSPLDPFPRQIFIHCFKPLSTANANLISMPFLEGNFSSIYITAQTTPFFKIAKP